MRKEGGRLIIEPAAPKSLLALLATLPPVEEDFAPIADLPPGESNSDALFARYQHPFRPCPPPQLEQAGTPIGGNGLLIATHAKALGFTVVTDNEREFARVEGLACENCRRGAHGRSFPSPSSRHVRTVGEHEKPAAARHFSAYSNPMNPLKSAKTTPNAL